MRKVVIKHVCDNRKYYKTVLRPGETVSDDEFDFWIKSMSDPQTYCDELALRAMADRCKMQLVIFRASELLVVINPRCGLVQTAAFLVNSGYHYKALVPQSEYIKACENSERLNKRK